MMEEGCYAAVREHASAVLKVEGSRFIADVFPATTEEEAKEALEGIRKKNFDATHHCYGYILGAERKLFRYSDDGEPNGTAGVKIHGAILAAGLSDTLVVITRYFGGTKLGVGGLGRAYQESAELGLRSASVQTKASVRECRISFPFSETNPIMNLIATHHFRIASTDYTAEETQLVLHLLPAQLLTIETLVTNATRGTARIELLQQRTVVWK